MLTGGNMKKTKSQLRAIPNAETEEAVKEVQRMKADPSLGKTYTDVDVMMKDLLTGLQGDPAELCSSISSERKYTKRIP